MDLLSLHARWPQRYPAWFESAARAGAQADAAQRLESNQPPSPASSDNGRFDILFAHPQAVIWKDREGRLHSEGVDGEPAQQVGPLDGAYRGFGNAASKQGTSHSGSFLDALDAWFARERIAPSPSALPFSGGWLIFLGYEMAVEAEPSLRLPPAPESIAAFAMRVPAAVIFDRLEQRTHIVTEPGFESLIPDIERDLADIQTNIKPDIQAAAAGGATQDLQEDAPQIYLDAVQQAKKHIAAGDIYQANLSREWRAHIGGSLTPAQIYQRLRAANPAPFAASCVWKDFAILSSSPERLFEIRDGGISTRPIAGTRRRSREPGADAEETSGLIAHPKERAEHIMLIDLERNDLGRICEPGSVRVDEFMALETYQHVHHIVSNVRGRLRDGVSPGEILRALFPGGTITGCPKVRCMQIIAELEGVGRGAYTGTLGYLNRDGSGDFNILIRTMVMQGGELRFRAGAGIVADSDPHRELEETRAKAEGLLRALRQ